MISQLDFNKSMESYIGDMRNKEEKEVKRKPVEKKLSVPREVDLYEENQPKKESLFSRIFKSKNVDDLEEYSISDMSEEDFSDDLREDMTVSQAAEEYEALSEVEEKVEKRKESLFKRLFTKKYVGAKSESEFDEQSISVYDKYKDSDDLAIIKNDLKKLGIITYDLIKRLDENELKKFKLSEDFNEYKEILKKYEMIRVRY